MSDYEKNMKRMHELICAMELDAKRLSKLLREKFGWGLSPRQVALYVGGVAKGNDLSEFVQKLEQLLGMRRDEAHFLSTANMNEVVRSWKKKLRECGADDGLSNITLILESAGVPACQFGAHLARDVKPNQKLLAEMEKAIKSAIALLAYPTKSNSLH